MNPRPLRVLSLLLSAVLLGACAPAGPGARSSADAGAAMCWGFTPSSVSNINCTQSCSELVRQCSESACTSSLNAVRSGVGPCPGFTMDACMGSCQQAVMGSGSSDFTFQVIAGCFQQNSQCSDTRACLSYCFAMIP